MAVLHAPRPLRAHFRDVAVPIGGGHTAIHEASLPGMKPPSERLGAKEAFKKCFDRLPTRPCGGLRVR
jgi:hypothetical protein